MRNVRDLRATGLDVSRETLDRLEAYCARLEQWSARINLIAPAPEGAVWARHILDSAQLFSLRHPAGRSWCDLGSGGGLPAIVAAIIGREMEPDLSFFLVESDMRKAAFLRIICTEMSLNARILQGRAEAIAPVRAQTVSARALAPLDRLLGYVHRHLDPSGVALLPKGRNYATEIEAAQKNWSFEMAQVLSIVDEDARILCIRQIRRNAGSA